MSAVRRSHSTASNGDIFPSVNRRWNSKPVVRRVVCSTCELELFKAIRVSAISASAPAVVPPKSWPGRRAGGAAFILLPTGTRNVITCTEGIHEKDCGSSTGKSGSSRPRKRPLGTKKERKAQLSRATFAVRKRTASLCYSVKLGPVTTRRPLALGTKATNSRFPRVWVRSIVGCGKLVKTNSHTNHKIFGHWCRNRLLVVVLSHATTTPQRNSTCAFRSNSRELTRLRRSKKNDNGLP